jgi:phosphoribosylformylglycinamidine (FGAM) synthase-like enzyme
MQPSEPLQGEQEDADLDFNAVQRGDAEMENRMNRLVRACAELGDRNPILSIHDQVNHIHLLLTLPMPS